MNDILFIFIMAASTVMMAGATLGAGVWLVLILTGRDLLAVEGDGDG